MGVGHMYAYACEVAMRIDGKEAALSKTPDAMNISAANRQLNARATKRVPSVDANTHNWHGLR